MLIDVDIYYYLTHFASLFSLLSAMWSMQLKSDCDTLVPLEGWITPNKREVEACWIKRIKPFKRINQGTRTYYQIRAIVI